MRNPFRSASDSQARTSLPFSLIDLVILLAIAIVGVVTYKLSPLLLAKADLTLEPIRDCDLNRKDCTAKLPDGGQITLAFAKQPVPVMKSFGINAQISGIDHTSIKSVEIDFAGADMNMGFNRRPLTAAGEGRYAGEATIPVCTTGRMTWRATLLVKTARQQIAVPFLFDAPVK